MKKASTLLVPVLLVGFCAAVVQSCASGETAPLSGGSGGDSGDGSGGDGSGGDSGDGSGGNSGSSSGGKVGSGGTTTTSSGGKVGSGGTTTTTSSGGKVGSGGTTTTTSSGGKVGSGGTTTTGSGGTTTPVGTGGTTTASCSGTNASAMNGYIMSTSWMGYAFTLKGGTGTTVMPDCSTSAATCYSASATSLCAMGTVAADINFNAIAGFGWNIDQAMSAPNPVTAVAPTGTGLAVNIPGATTDMRMQLSDGGSPEITWCASMPANGMGTIPWASFTKTCYDTGTPGAAYSSATKIAKVEVIVPSKSVMTVPFCFCVVSIGPG